MSDAIVRIKDRALPPRHASAPARGNFDGMLDGIQEKGTDQALIVSPAEFNAVRTARVTDHEGG